MFTEPFGSSVAALERTRRRVIAEATPPPCVSSGTRHPRAAEGVTARPDTCPTCRSAVYVERSGIIAGHVA